MEPIAGWLWSKPRDPNRDWRETWLMNEERVTIQDGHEWDLDAAYLCLPYYILDGSGLFGLKRGNDVVLFNRAACKMQINFILESVIRRGKDGLILGQTGTGKSTTTFFVSCCLRHNHGIVWIHMDSATDLAYVISIQGNVMRKVSVPIDQLSLYTNPTILDHGNTLNSRTILIIDSLDLRDPSQKRFLIGARRWREQDCINRRLICVCSDSGHDSETGRIYKEFRVHGVGSWSLEEYLTAITSNNFWENVKNAFLGCRAELSERTKLVESKYYYAGTCARSMFASSIEEIEQDIFLTIAEMSPSAIDCTWTESFLTDPLKHSLMSYMYEEDTLLGMTGFVSQYAAREFGEATGPAAIQALARVCVSRTDPKALEWIFEAFFLASIAEKSELIVRPISRIEKHTRIVWTCHQYSDMRLASFSPQSLEHKVQLDTWLRPNSPQQPGFDVVMLLSTGMIRFIQTTVAQKHDLKMWALADLVKRLRQLGHEVKDAEVFFVIPDNYAARDFRISQLHGWEEFAALFGSWPKQFDAVKEKLQTVTISF